MRIHWHSPPSLTQPPPLRKPPTPLETESQAVELVAAAQALQSRLKKLFGARKNPDDPDEDSRFDEDNSRSPSKQNVDLIA